MLSLIICSRNSDISHSLKTNIAITIGVDYELVIIDNSEKKHSIFSAYNEGIHRSHGEYLCFMHDDIKYISKNWGNIVINYLRNPRVGALGVYGGHYIPRKQCYIGDTTLISGIMYNNKRLLNYEKYFKGNKFAYVAALDGVWFCIRKELFSRIKFDESYKGFHFYEMDICMQINNLDRKLIVTKEILVTHLSGGTINKNFLDNQNKFFIKWEKQLPIIKGITISNEVKEIIDCLCNELLWQRKLFVELEKVIKEYQVINNSRAYKLGKMLLKPMHSLKNLLK